MSPTLRGPGGATPLARPPGDPRGRPPHAPRVPGHFLLCDHFLGLGGSETLGVMTRRGGRLRCPVPARRSRRPAAAAFAAEFSGRGWRRSLLPGVPGPGRKCSLVLEKHHVLNPVTPQAEACACSRPSRLGEPPGLRMKLNVGRSGGGPEPRGCAVHCCVAGGRGDTHGPGGFPRGAAAWWEGAALQTPPRRSGPLAADSTPPTSRLLRDVGGTC